MCFFLSLYGCQLLKFLVGRCLFLRRFAFLAWVAYALVLVLFFFKYPAPTEIYTLSLHDALPISVSSRDPAWGRPWPPRPPTSPVRGGGRARRGLATTARGTPRRSTRYRSADRRANRTAPRRGGRAYRQRR